MSVRHTSLGDKETPSRQYWYGGVYSTAFCLLISMSPVE
jgi:hypothetical protein